MKKFLLYLLILVFATSFTGLVFYLARDDEFLNAESKTIYLNAGEVVDPEFSVDNIKKSTKITISSSDEGVVVVEEGKLRAVGKGSSVVSITLKNAKKATSVISQKIVVGDGSQSNPFFVRNEMDIAKIGTTYGSDKCFEQTADIVFTSEPETITLFSGVYNGKGFKLINYKKTGAKQTSAFINQISEQGVFCFVRFENVDIDGTFDNASVIARVNRGLIDYCEVSGKIYNRSTVGSCSGISAYNYDDAQIQRCTAKMNIKTNGVIVGGIVAFNNATITSCINGDTSLISTANCDFELLGSDIENAHVGGIVAENENIGDTTNISNNLCVNRVIIQEEATITTCFFGGIIGVDYNDADGFLNLDAPVTKYIFGNYYLYSSSSDWYNKGIANVSITTPDNENNIYIANGLTYQTFQSSSNSILVSYTTSFNSGAESLTSWPENIWVIDEVGFPYLISMSAVQYIPSKIEIDLPKAIVGADFEIPNAYTYYLFASRGDFTKTENAGETFYITGDLDFESEPFIVVGTVDKPVVVNFKGQYIEGKYPTISNITVSNSTQLLNSENEKVSIDGCKDIGMFGYVQNVSLEFLKLKNCNINGSSISGSQNVGGIVGRAINSNITNCEFTADKNASGGYLGSVTGGESAVSVGGIAGSFDVSEANRTNSIYNCHSIVEVAMATTSTNDCFVGGIVGELKRSISSSEDSNSFTTGSSCSFNGIINISANTKGYAGGFAGKSSAKTQITGYDSTYAAINANYAGGICSISSGKISQSSSTSTLNANYAGGFVYKLNDSGVVDNCYCETEFAGINVTVNAGIACDASDNARFINCVNFNKFNKESTPLKNFAKLGKDVKFEFVCDRISELNFYAGNDNRNVILQNCFYVNQIDGKDSADYKKIKFFTQSGSVPGWPEALEAFGVNYVDAKVASFPSTKFNGTLRNGRMLSTGGIVNNDLRTDVTWNELGFSSEIWKNASSAIVSGNVLYF